MNFEYLDEEGEICFSILYNQPHLNAKGSKPAHGEIRVSRWYHDNCGTQNGGRYGLVVGRQTVFLPTFVKVV